MMRIRQDANPPGFETLNVDVCFTASCEAALDEERRTYFQHMLDILAARDKNKDDREEEIICGTGSDVIAFVSAVQVGRKLILIVQRRCCGAGAGEKAPAPGCCCLA